MKVADYDHSRNVKSDWIAVRQVRLGVSLRRNMLTTVNKEIRRSHEITVAETTEFGSLGWGSATQTYAS